MTTITTEQLLRHFIGFDRVASNSANFPPHNIAQISEDSYVLTLAVAGYSRDEINIYVERGILTILGRKIASDEITYLHRGIAARDWDREFNLGEHIEVVDAGLADGLLTITLERQIPEEQRPKAISIR